jgi:uncharacterized protein YggE
MRFLIVAAFLAATAAPALAQTAVTTGGQAGVPRLYDPAPWWMRESVIASTGHVRTEIASNRANFSASFQAVERTAADATRIAADKVRALGQALAAYGPQAVRVETTFNMRPLYDQYRDAQGQLIDNQRADRIERYEVNAQVAIEVREVANLERAYATVLSAQPNSTTPVYFRLEPDNATRTELFGLAVADAARRAKLATDATGARLGAVKLIDPTSRACQTDVLVAGAPRSDAVGDTPYQDVMVTASRAAAPPPAPMMAAKADGAGGQVLDPASMQLPLQPPLQELTAAACVVYALG